MKNKFALLSILVLFIVGNYNIFAQNDDTIAQNADTIATEESVMSEEDKRGQAAMIESEKKDEEPASFHQII
tara:strand:+ start:175 stop:390 length:216 start_codon:yes stop_codon:yes gene_type:complete